MIPRKYIEKAFSNKEQENMIIEAQVQFPTEDQVKADVDVVKTIQRLKKNAFMDSVNTNKIAKDMRPELLNTKLQKNRLWVDDVDGKVKARLEERIKILSVNKPDDDVVSKCEAVMVDDQGIHTPLDSVRSGHDHSNDFQASMHKS